jgi:hypothetical protein
MNSRKFFTHFIENDKTDIIKNGFQQSQFNCSSIKISDIIKTILLKYEYGDLGCQQNGMPADKSLIESKKMSYCTNFDIIIDNILGLFGYEFCKYILFKINGTILLNKYLNIIKTECNNYSSFEEMLHNFITIFTSMNFKIKDQRKFEADCKQTSFYLKHNTILINEIFKGINKDIFTERNNIINFNEIKNGSLEILHVIIDNVCTEKVVINTLNELIIEFGNMDVDVGYSGSFIQIATKLYENTPFTDEVLSKYELKTKINQSYFQNLNQWFKNMIERILKLYPNITLIIDDGLINYLINIIVDYFIYLGHNMAILYNITLGFEKASRIHFKTIYNAIMITISKYDDYTPSQKTILHYVLLNRNNIQKSIEMIDSEINPNEKHDKQEKKIRKKRTKKNKKLDLD